MKREHSTHEYATDVKGITAIAVAIIHANDTASQGRASYLRSLLAGTQAELVGKPVLRALRAPHKISAEQALAAFEKVNEVYYAAVLSAVPEGLSTLERQAKTSFARSSASTMRRALKAGWDPLTPINGISKVALYRWVADHAGPPRPVTFERAQSRVATLVERIQEAVQGLSAPEAQAVMRAAVAELAPETPRIKSLSLRRHPPERVAAH